jgi:hypothetical protein
VGCGAKPHDLHTVALSWIEYIPPLRGGAENKKFAGVGSAHDLHPDAQSQASLRQILHRQANPFFLGIDREDFHLHDVADFDHIEGVFHEFIG